MDAQRSRRTKDKARKAWYAYYRQVRFARWLGFIEVDRNLNFAFRQSFLPGSSGPSRDLDCPVIGDDWDAPVAILQPPVSSSH